MAAMTRPRRRLPSRVYWVRRLVVLGVALGVVLGLVFGVVRLLGTAADGSLAAVTAGGSPSPTRPPTADETAGRSRAPVPRPSSSATGTPRDPAEGNGRKQPLPLPEGSCEPSEVIATPTLRGPAYGGRRVTFRVELTSTGPAACTWNASASSMVVKLTSGEDRIWSTQDCPEAIEPTGVVVRRSVPGIAKVTWHGLRSDDECTNTTEYALPGWYHVEAAAFGSEPSSTQFELEKPDRPTITASPSPAETPDRDRARQG